MKFIGTKSANPIRKVIVIKLKGYVMKFKVLFINKYSVVKLMITFLLTETEKIIKYIN